MKSFQIGSYQLRDNKKWVPAGNLVQLIDGGASMNVQEISYPDHHFDTKEEADKFFSEQCILRGHKPAKKK